MFFAAFKCILTPCRDTAGQERYASLAPLYYRGASAATVVYDITNAESFQKAKHWVSELQKNASGAIGEQIGDAEQPSMAYRTCFVASWILPLGITPHISLRHSACIGPCLQQTVICLMSVPC